MRVSSPYYLVGMVFSVLIVLTTAGYSASIKTDGWTLLPYPQYHDCMNTSSEGLGFVFDETGLRIVFDLLEPKYWQDDTVDVFYTHVYKAEIVVQPFERRFHFDMNVVEYGLASDYGLPGDDVVISLDHPIADRAFIDLLQDGSGLDVSIGQAEMRKTYSLAESRRAIDDVATCYADLPRLN